MPLTKKEYRLRLSIMALYVQFTIRKGPQQKGIKAYSGRYVALFK